MELKFYNKKTRTNTHVGWKCLDQNNKFVGGEESYACFSPITYNKIHQTVTKIVVFRSLDLIPYDLKIITLWIKELNKLGFPCEVKLDEKDKNVVNFTLELKNFKYKMHINCTLQLIRALFESYIAFVPEAYFNLVKKSDDNETRFKKLQLAHFEVSGGNLELLDEINGHPNTNHMVTFKNNVKDLKTVSQETFWENMEETKHLVYSENYSSLSGMWREKNNASRGY